VLTVGLCAYNEGKNIEGLLNLILEEINEKDEVIIVLSPSEDDTEKRVKSFRDERIKLIVEDKRYGKSLALNKLFREAKGDFLLYISADSLPKKGSILKLVKALKEDGNLGLVCADCFPLNEEKGWVNKMGILLWNFHRELMEELSKFGELKHASDMYCVRREILKEIPKDVINDDGYIALLVKKRGFRIKFVKEAKVFILSPKKIHEFFYQRRRIIFGHIKNKRLLGEIPNYFGYLIFSKFKLSIRLIKRVLISRPYIVEAFLLILLELLSYSFALLDILFKRDHRVWKTIYSTKEDLTSFLELLIQSNPIKDKSNIQRNPKRMFRGLTNR